MKRSILIFVLLFSIKSFSQELGFGCFGLLGGFAGYEIQNYQPDGLNAYITSFNTHYADSITYPLGKFEQLHGFRFGLNLFRKNFSGLVVTFKTFYGSGSEKKTTTLLLPDKTKAFYTAEVKLNSYTAGVDIGMTIVPGINWKVFDLGVNYLNASFTTQTDASRGTLRKDTYSSSGNVFGYSIGSGFIVNVIQEYITLEGTVAFSSMTIDEINDSNENPLKYVSSDANIRNFIRRGGLVFLIQLNLGLPS